MKRLTIVLWAITVLGLLLISSAVVARPALIPHENPNVVGGLSDTTVELLSSYVSALDKAGSGQYLVAWDMLSQIKPAHIPEELRPIADRYQALYSDLLSDLGSGASLLDEASARLDNNQTGVAEDRLARADIAVRNAQVSLEDVKKTTDTLGDKLGALSTPVTNEVKQLSKRLDNSLNQLRLRTDELPSLQNSLSEKCQTQAAKLKPVELSLSVATAEVFVGDSVTVSGKLSSDGGPLSGRKVSLLLDKKPVSVFNTKPDGSYAISLNIPREYIPDMALVAEYIPSGADINVYQGCESQSVPVMFQPTLLEVSMPKIVYPGIPFMINGLVSSTDDNIDRTVRVLFGNISLAERSVQGRFSFEVNLPRQVSIGEHYLTIEVMPQERRSGVVKRTAISVSGLTISADIQSPTLVIMPQSVQVSGRVYHDLGPVQNAEISLGVGQPSAITKTAPDGSFATVTASTTDVLACLLPFSLQELMIDIKAVEPGSYELQVKRQVIIMNPISAGLMLAILVSLAMVLYKRRPVKLPEVAVNPQPVKMRLPTYVSVEPHNKFTDIKTRILSAYASGLGVIEEITGISTAPYLTLREFLGVVTPSASGVVKQFHELTTIAEMALYSGHTLNEDLAERAEGLADIIKEGKYRGAS